MVEPLEMCGKVSKNRRLYNRIYRNSSMYVKSTYLPRRSCCMCVDCTTANEISKTTQQKPPFRSIPDIYDGFNVKFFLFDRGLRFLTREEINWLLCITKQIPDSIFALKAINISKLEELLILYDKISEYI